MTVTTVMKLRKFNFWSGGKHFADNLTFSELDDLEMYIKELYPDGLTATDLNDLFWFEDDYLCQLLNLDIDEVYNR